MLKGLKPEAVSAPLAQLLEQMMKEIEEIKVEVEVVPVILPPLNVRDLKELDNILKKIKEV